MLLYSANGIKEPSIVANSPNLLECSQDSSPIPPLISHDEGASSHYFLLSKATSYPESVGPPRFPTTILDLSWLQGCVSKANPLVTAEVLRFWDTLGHLTFFCESPVFNMSRSLDTLCMGTNMQTSLLCLCETIQARFQVRLTEAKRSCDLT